MDDLSLGLMHHILVGGRHMISSTLNVLDYLFLTSSSLSWPVLFFLT